MENHIIRDVVTVIAGLGSLGASEYWGNRNISHDLLDTESNLSPLCDTFSIASPPQPTLTYT